MLHQLKKIFPSIIPYTGAKPDGYVWFVADELEPIGIHKDDATKKDIALLAAFLNPYFPNVPVVNHKAKLWQKRIHETSDEMASEPFRFVYFLILKNQIEPETLQEALNELFNQETPILWLNETEAVLIETIPFLDSKVNYEQFIHVLIADLSVNIRFYVGEIRKSYTALKTYYDNILNQASIVFSSTTKEVVYYAESISHLLLHHLPTEDKRNIVSSILGDFQHDTEMLKTLRVFFESDLNMSETAKNLYMHRNSVQYRVDKYINETGINIQNFNEAIGVKTALLAKE